MSLILQQQIREETTSISSLSPSSSLIESLPSCLITRKRKRSSNNDKKVRFDVDHIVIIDTYSASDYDRGSPFSLQQPVQYKINPDILANNNNFMIPTTNRIQPKLSLEIPPPSPSSPCDSEASNIDIETPTATTTTTIASTTSMLFNKGHHNKKRPKLTVDTSLCTDGPLFFTKLSTNHYRHTIHNNDNDDDDYSNDYLVPINNTPVTATTTTFSY